MDTILDMTKVFLSSICFSLLPTDVAWDNIHSFCSYRVIALKMFSEENAPVTNHNRGKFLYDLVQWVMIYCMRLDIP